MKSRGSLIISTLLMFSLILSACSGGKATTQGTKSPEPSAATTPGAAATAPPDNKKEEQVLNLVAGQEITTLNTVGLYDNPAAATLNNLLEGLYRLGPDNVPTPGMAKSYDLSSDGKIYTFHLREDAKWSNGKPVTASDFDYAWRKALSPDQMSQFAAFFDDIVNGADIRAKKKDPSTLGVKVVDEHTFEVTLSKPVAYFLSLTTVPVFYPQNKEFVDSQGDKYGLESNQMIYNGPFALENWKHEESWSFKKNPTYWDAANVKLDQINFKVVKEVSTRINLYEAGQLDITGLSSEFTEQYRDKPEYTTYLDPEVRYIMMNQKNKYLKNVNIRKALNMAWNKEDMTKVILNNGSIPANYLVPKSFVNSPDGKDFRDGNDGYNMYNLDEAKKFWDLGLKELGVTSIKLDYLNYDGEQDKTIAQYLKNQLEKNLPGLSITINPQPQKQKLALTDKLEYDFTSSGWGPDYPDPMTYIENFTSDSPYNWSAYNSPKYDQLIKDVRASTDPAARWKMLIEAERVLLEEDAVIISMSQTGIARLTKSYVKGFVSHPFGVYSSYKWISIEGK